MWEHNIGLVTDESVKHVMGAEKDSKGVEVSWNGVDYELVVAHQTSTAQQGVGCLQTVDTCYFTEFIFLFKFIFFLRTIWEKNV